MNNIWGINMFKPQVYKKRRTILSNHFKSGILLFIGNDESQILVRDTVRKFRQNSTFLYYWGINEPNLAALIDVDKNIEILFGHDLTTNEIVWEGEQQKLIEKTKLINVNKTAEIYNLKNVLLNYRKGRRKIHYLPQHLSENKIKISALLNIPFNKVNDNSSLQLIRAVIEQRSIKSKREVAEIEKALKISRKLHLVAMRKSVPGKFEHEVVSEMEKVLIDKTSRWAYLPIFTADGDRLHNHHYNNKMKQGQLIVNDAGAESPKSFYSSDITRTFPVSGKFTNQQKDIYNIVLKAQLTAIKALKPGVKFLDVHLQSAKIIASGLKKLGLMRGNIDDAVSTGAHALFFPHGLGHLLGLDVHDMEDLGEDYVGYTAEIKRSKQFGTAYLRFAKELQPGHVLTIEPGIYFIPQLIKQWQQQNQFTEFINYKLVNKYIGFGGIRIEDNILVTKNGCKVLGKPIPKTVAEIEAIMSI